MTRLSRILLTLTAAITVAVLSASPAGAAKRQVPFGFVGMNFDATDPSVAVDDELHLMVRSGVESMRIPVFWAGVQPYAHAAEVPGDQRGRFVDVGGVPTDFSALDGEVGAAAARGIRVMPTVTATPGWAALKPGNAASPPRDPATYARFMSTLVRRYGPRGVFWRGHPGTHALPVQRWQIWNEPGQAFYWDQQPFARSYVRLLRVARAAIKSIDPRARVVLAGLNSGFGYISWKHLDTVYRAGGRGLFDEVAANAFNFRTRNLIRTLEMFRQVMGRHRDGRTPLILSEFSWPSSLGQTKLRFGFEVNERDQALRVAEALPQLARDRRRLGLSQIYWYNWMSPPLGSPQPFDYAGLRRRAASGGVSKPALEAFARAAHRLEGCTKASVATRCG